MRASEFDLKVGRGCNKGPSQLLNQQEVYLALKRAKTLLGPHPMRQTSTLSRNNGKYYEYHDDNNHLTTDYWALVRAIREQKEAPNAPLPPLAHIYLRSALIPIGHQQPKAKL